MRTAVARYLFVALLCLIPIYIGAQDPDLHTTTNDIETLVPGLEPIGVHAGPAWSASVSDDAVVVIANHHWLPSDGEYSKEGDVTIYPGGVIKFKKGLTPDAAAKKFWDAVGSYVAKQPCETSTLASK